MPRLRFVSALALSTAALVACEFEDVSDYFSSTTEEWSPRVAAFAQTGELFVAHEDAGAVYVEVFEGGTRVRSVELEELVSVAGAATTGAGGTGAVMDTVTLVGLGDGDSTLLVRLDVDGDTLSNAVDLRFIESTERFVVRVEDVCDLATAYGGTTLVSTIQSMSAWGMTYYTAVVVEVGSTGVTGRKQLTAGLSVPDCHLITNDHSTNVTWAVPESGGVVYGLDPYLLEVDSFTLSSSGTVKDIEAHNDLIAVAVDRGSSNVMEPYTGGYRYDIIAVDGTTALAAERDSDVPASCSDDGGLLWRVNQDDDGANLHAHEVCE